MMNGKMNAKEALEVANNLSTRNKNHQMQICYEAIFNSSMNGYTKVDVDLDPNYVDHCVQELTLNLYKVSLTKNGLTIDWSFT